MKCNSWVRHEPVEGSPFNAVHPGFFQSLEKYGEAWYTPLREPGGFIAPYSLSRQRVTDRSLLAEKTSYSRCFGEITCSIEPYEEPYYGGVSARVGITYSCSTCDNRYFPDLPSDQYDVAHIVTKHIEELPDPVDP